MTTLDIKLTLPDSVARQAQAAGLLSAEAIEELLREAIRKRARKTARKPNATFGMWADRADVTDSAAYVRALRRPRRLAQRPASR